MPGIGEHLQLAAKGSFGTYTNVSCKLVSAADIEYTDGSNSSGSWVKGDTGRFRRLGMASDIFSESDGKAQGRYLRVTDDNGRICLIKNALELEPPYNLNHAFPVEPGYQENYNMLLAESPYGRDNNIYQYASLTPSMGSSFVSRNITAIPPLNETVIVDIEPFGQNYNAESDGTYTRDGFVQHFNDDSSTDLDIYNYRIKSITRQANTGRTGQGTIIVEYPWNIMSDTSPQNVANGREIYQPGIKQFKFECYKENAGYYRPRITYEFQGVRWGTLEQTNQLNAEGNPDWDNFYNPPNWFAENDLHIVELDSTAWNVDNEYIFYDEDGYAFFTAEHGMSIPPSVFPVYARIVVDNNAIYQAFNLDASEADQYYVFDESSTTYTDEQGQSWNFWIKELTLPVPSAENTCASNTDFGDPGESTGPDAMALGTPALTSDTSMLWQEVDVHGTATESINNFYQSQDIQLSRLDDYSMLKTFSIRYKSSSSLLVELSSGKGEYRHFNLPPTGNKMKSVEKIIGMRCKTVKVSVRTTVESSNDDFELYQIELGYV